MGATLLGAASSEHFEISGAIDASTSKVGRSLTELGLRNDDLRIQSPSSLKTVLEASDVCLSFTTPDAELQNVPVVASSGKPLVLGTTGFSQAQRDKIEGTLRGSVPAVVSSNFSVGANMLFALSASLKRLPENFDVSILEMHHSGKADAPSGTALRIAEIVSAARGYTEKVYGRSGISKRKREELEISALRGGGTPGEHIVYAFGPHEMLKVEHLSFSRSAFAQGALMAAEWAVKMKKPGIYSMLDVLGFTLD